MQGTKVTRHTTAGIITRCISNIKGDFWNNFYTENTRKEVRIEMLVTTARLIW